MGWGSYCCSSLLICVVLKVSPQHSNWRASLAEELSLVTNTPDLADNSRKVSQLQVQAKKPPPRPAAPPPRPSAPPSRPTGQTISRNDHPKPSRLAPAAPGQDVEADSDFFSAESPVCTDVTSTASSYSLASLAWPEDDSPPVLDKSQSVQQSSMIAIKDQTQPPLVPIRTKISEPTSLPPTFEPPPFSPPSLPCDPPPFSPPSLPSEPPAFTPPSLPPPGPPPSRPTPALLRLPDRPAPPPLVPRRR